MKRIYIRLIIFFTTAGLLALIVYLLISYIPKPPVKDIENARISLAKAFKSKADTYSKEYYNEAKINFDSAMSCWQKENAKFIYFRSYDKVARFSRLSTIKSKQAIDYSNQSTSSYKVKLKERIRKLNNIINDIDTYFNRYPLPNATRKDISKGKLQLKEAEIDYNKGQYIPANKKISSAEVLLNNSYDEAYNDLEQYFKFFSQWKKWANQAIKDSKNNQNYSILVDKLSRKCYVYYSGKIKYEFDCDLGRNWVGDKKKMGDKATPEGMYKIVNKYTGTKYNNALLLDYPNEEDIVRFNKEKSKGLIHRNTKIGNGIEIHGSGGKGVDWTEGCIALEDKEMAIVYRLASIGTPVTIVGSLKSFDEILSR